MSTPLLRRAALRYAEHGWPLAPGAWWASRTYHCTVQGCRVDGLHPAQHPVTAALGEVLNIRSAVPADEVEATWDRPYALLAPTGVRFDVIQVPCRAMRLPPPPSLAAPVAILDTAGVPMSWLVFAQPGAAVPLDDPVRRVRGAVVHQGESWVPLPPSPLAGRVRWHRRPSAVRWELPTLNVALAAVTERLITRRADVPPQRRARRLRDRVARSA